jgi:DNA-binding winged helix-turn-helix (wHTH) protein/TolB-like protein/Tfp pilus assembly protein PilF
VSLDDDGSGVAAGGRESIRFGPFELELRSHELRRDGELVALRQQAARILALLAQRPGELITREEIKEQVWGADGASYADQGLNDCIRDIRVALDDQARRPVYVATLPRRGYRFLAPVSQGGEMKAGVAPAPPVPGRRARALGLAGLLAAVLLAGLGLHREGAGDAFSPRPPVRVAVRGFQDLGGQAGYFSDGLREELIAQLGRLEPGQLEVIALSASAGEADLLATPGIDYVLEGSVRYGADRARITVNLVRTESQTQAWAGTFERDLGDILRVQSDVARAVARELQVVLSPEAEARLADPPPVDPEAYRLLLKGRHLWGRMDVPSLRRSVEYFERALALQSDYALAHSSLADAYLKLGEHTAMHQDEVMRLARRSVEKALELDPDLAEAYVTLGWIQSNYELDWESAERSYLRALELNPSSPRAHQWYTHLLRATGRIDAAVREARIALELDPVGAMYGVNLGFALNDSGDHAGAYQEFEKVLEMHPDFPPALLGRGYTLLALGREQEAIAAMERAAERVGESALFDGTLAYTYAMAGHRDQARAVLERMIAAPVRSPFLIALVCVSLAEPDPAFEWLERALVERDPRARTVASDARFEPLRDDPRYPGLVARFGLAATAGPRWRIEGGGP